MRLLNQVPGYFFTTLIPTGQIKKRVIDKTGFQNLAGLKSRWLNAT